MNAVRQVLIEDRRWYVLDAIAQMADRRLNEEIILVGIRDSGRPAQVNDIREDLEHLEREGCVTLERYIRGPGRQYWIATLTAEGLQARDNLRTVPGVASRKPL
ncbi:hypothetical protein Gbth_017_159 [Gluconobacter thailandicus F149-1 = NBRC 100600]|uniref:Uncharacterized protein n=1 Tax=Gluconobacter thailandicus NBRC 3257 TaxID=1381097 RepID=A0ABQ0IW60_GLUTH|nr:hypothetical protein [Gluconobacter thailandicus]KXV54162.1 hypothetical protein AD946_04310 [Gluconobacter thailandicus]GAD26447.1 hypothetical protein NBRC3257_1446 [Gluconobacter thailandicus NBRC 3257]GAN92984.1 hypothetical protein Gbth_017_159 [Gluconobacter thailandicus F149-1 = NBRC 100600]GBR61596.1 hypothetical protein AA100600_2934 [Gluconobacter thailandicus F149-1 = NBRC 100600]GEL87467.1 hypothetical protein GTH01_18250 [Gluconobacter thailandicus F149-1 = NBRC 100600]